MLLGIHLLDIVGIVFLSSILLVFLTILSIIMKVIKTIKNVTVGGVIDIFKSLWKKIKKIKIF